MKVMIVDDSALIRGILKQILLHDSEFKVCAEYANGKNAVENVESKQPDLIIMDIDMPIMNGIEATRQIMEQNPVPILIFTSEDVAQVGFRAVSHGAVDIFKKPSMGQITDETFIRSFLDKLKEVGSKTLPRKYFHVPEEKISGHRPKPASRQYMVLIGASTGGPGAVRTVLKQLPASFHWPIAIVQHLESGFDKGYAQWLNDNCALNVRMAINGDRPQPGEVIVAPVGKHLICSRHYFYLDDGPSVLNQKPAVDRLFQTAAKDWKDQAVAVLLTGMGRDGAQGCMEIKQSGGQTLVQDEKSSAIFGMPKSAIELGAAMRILPLDEIAANIMEVTGY